MRGGGGMGWSAWNALPHPPCRMRAGTSGTPPLPSHRALQLTSQPGNYRKSTRASVHDRNHFLQLAGFEPQHLSLGNGVGDANQKFALA